MVPLWSRSSRRPLSRVMGVLSTEAKIQPRECLGEEEKSSERLWCVKGLEGEEGRPLWGSRGEKRTYQIIKRGRQGQNKHNKGLE